MTTRQTKPRKLPEDDAWAREVASVMNWASDWAKRKTKLALREGGKCGFCGYTPEKQTEHIKGKRLRQLTKRELLYRHMKDHLAQRRYGDRRWKHPPEKSGRTHRRSSDFANSTEFPYDRERARRFPHRGWIKPKWSKP